MSDQKQKRRRSGFGCCTASRTAGMVMVAAGWLDGWCMVTVAHALVHRIRGTASNLLFRLYVGQEWLSPSTLSMGGAWEEVEVDWHYIDALRSKTPHFQRLSNCRPPLILSASFGIKSFFCHSRVCVFFFFFKANVPRTEWIVWTRREKSEKHWCFEPAMTGY